MIMYNVTFGTEDEILGVDDFESIPEVCEFLDECLVEHGEGDWSVGIAAFEQADEVVEDEP